MIGLLISYGFVFLVIGIATLLDHLKIIGDEGSRKFIHVGVSNWWIIAIVFFKPEEWYLAIIPPATFIILNYLSFRFNLVKSMERDKQSSNDLGTVYYAISLFLITFISFFFAHTQENSAFVFAGAIPILVMGYGDGLAALIGKNWGTKKLFLDKTYLGFTVMLIVSFVIALVFLLIIMMASIFWLWIVLLAILIALMAAMIELLTPSGLDNLSVPLLIFLFLVILL